MVESFVISVALARFNSIPIDFMGKVLQLIDVTLAR